MDWSLIGRNSKGRIDSQIDILADEFQKVGNSKEIPEGAQFSDGEGVVLPDDGKMGHPHSKMSEWDGQEKEERPKRKRREKQNPWKLN